MCHKQVGIERYSTKHTESLEIPKGNFVLLHDHPESHNKIQDKYKSEEFVVVGKHPDPNVYHIKPVNGNGPEWIVN